MCVFVCISHTCRNLNFAKNVTTLLHWAVDMKCLINSVKNSSSKKKKKSPTYLPYFCSACYANITIFFFWPNLAIRHLFVLFNVPCQVVSRLMPGIKTNKQRIILKHIKKENNKLNRVSMSLCLFIMIIAMCLMRQSYVTYQLVEPMWFV